MDVALLPSLAEGGCGALELRPQDDPALLTLLPEARKGKGGLTGSGSSPLVSGTPLGLMAYLYARLDCSTHSHTDAQCTGDRKHFIISF